MVVQHDHYQIGTIPEKTVETAMPQMRPLTEQEITVSDIYLYILFILVRC